MVVLEAQLAHEGVRFEFAALFGRLLTEWLDRKGQAEEASASGVAEVEEEFEQVIREETLEQKAKLKSIFEEKIVDVDALKQYLDNLFSEKFTADALENEIRVAIGELKTSSAWKEATRTLTREENARRDAFFGTESDNASLQQKCKQYQTVHYFMCQLPESLESATDNYLDHFSDEKDEPAHKGTKRSSTRFSDDSPEIPNARGPQAVSPAHAVYRRCHQQVPVRTMHRGMD